MKIQKYENAIGFFTITPYLLISYSKTLGGLFFSFGWLNNRYVLSIGEKIDWNLTD